MQSKVTRYAAAAVLILGVFLGLYKLGISPDGSSVAWASLAKHVKQIKTVVYRTHITMQGMPGDSNDELTELECLNMISSDYGMKFDMTTAKGEMTSIYMLFAEKEMITFMPSMKKYTRVTLTDDIRDKMKKQSYDPVELVAGFMGAEFTVIGQKEIDGVLAEGVKIEKSNFDGFPFEIITGELWVDINNDLPILVEMEMQMEMADSVITMKCVSDDFKWNVELDKSEFTYAIPEDYESLGEMKMPEMSADAAIGGIKMLMEFNADSFPNDLNMMNVMNKVSEYRRKQSKEKSNARIKAIEDAVQAGIDPNTFLADKENIQDMTQRIMDEATKMMAPCMFYMQLVQEKKDPAYFGDRVSPADTDMILMRWLNDKGGYTVIFADLSTGDFSAEEVGEMEAKLPQL